MKKVINVILGIAALAMLFICYRSIADRQDFEAEVKQREADVKARLMDIRKAENAFKEQNPQIGFCADWDSLIAFIKEGKLPVVVKQGVLTEDQMEKGLTDSKAAAIVARGDAAEIAANGLQGFRRDTAWVSLLDSLYGHKENFNVEDIRYIPHSDADGGEKKEFDLIAVWIKTKSDAIIPVMECAAEVGTYIVGESKNWSREASNQRKIAEGMGNYPGLKIGEAGLNWNNNAGNWE